MTQKTARMVETTIVPAAVKIGTTHREARQHLAVARAAVKQLASEADRKQVAAQVLPRQAAVVTQAAEPQLVTEADLDAAAEQVVRQQRGEPTRAVVLQLVEESEAEQQWAVVRAMPQ